MKFLLVPHIFTIKLAWRCCHVVAFDRMIKQKPLINSVLVALLVAQHQSAVSTLQKILCYEITMQNILCYEITMKL